MNLTPSFWTRIANPAEWSFDRLCELDYLHAVGLEQGGLTEGPLRLYVRYFRAEQEERRLEQERLFTESGTRTDDTRYAMVREILTGRRLLQSIDLQESDIAAWIARCERQLPSALLAYSHFLAAAGFSTVRAYKRAALHSARSAAEFAAAGFASRELQTILQSPQTSIGEMRYLQSYARKEHDLKSYHIANLRLASDLIRHLRPEQNVFTPKELQLLRRLEAGAATKSRLLEELYGSSSFYADKASIDMRFRSLLSRLNKKLHQRIVREGGVYRLQRD